MLFWLDCCFHLADLPLFMINSIYYQFLQVVFREDMLRRDIEDLQKRYQVSFFPFLLQLYPSMFSFLRASFRLLI